MRGSVTIPSSSRPACCWRWRSGGGDRAMLHGEVRAPLLVRWYRRAPWVSGRRPVGRQFLQVPVDETRGVGFLQRIGSGLEESGVHAGLIHFDDLLVFD